MFPTRKGPTSEVLMPATAERRGKLRGAASFAGLGSRRTQFDVLKCDNLSIAAPALSLHGSRPRPLAYREPTPAQTRETYFQAMDRDDSRG